MSAGDTIDRIRSREQRKRDKRAQLIRMNWERMMLRLPPLDDDWREIVRPPGPSVLDRLRTWWRS